MPITPTSTKSKQYQALGIDEIANDIETVFNTANSLQDQIDNLPQGGGGTTTVVNISSAQILAMGTTPIELLPTLPNDQYYRNISVILEYTHNTTNYTIAPNDKIYIWSNEADILPLVSGLLLTLPYNNLAETGTMGGYSLDDVNGYTYASVYTFPTSDNLVMNMYSGTNPTLGDGTLRAIITYTTRTFGA